MKILILLCYVISHSAYGINECPYSENAIKPEIKVSITQLKDGKFQYNYIVKNKNGGKLPIKWFFIETNKLHEAVNSPEGWVVMDWGNASSELLKWTNKDYLKGEIKVGDFLDGFGFISKSKPGLIRYQSQGANYLPSLKQNVSHESVKGLCPGNYYAGSTIPGQDYIEGLTMGPIPSNRISVELRIKRPSEKNWTGHYQAADSELLAFSPIEKGKVEVALLSDDELNPEDINISTIEFGRGKSRPLNAAIADCELSPKKSTKALIMTFDLYSINVLCNTDHALFLRAKTKDGKDVFSGVKIRPIECTQENWKREADKMIEAGEFDLPKGKYKIKD